MTPPSRWAAIEMMVLLSAAGWILFGEAPPTKDPNGLGQSGERALASEGISGAWRGSESLHRRLSRLQLNAPMVFEANHGQTHSSVEMLARGRGYTSFFTSRQIVVAMETNKSGSRPAVRMELVGANPAPRIRGTKPLPGRSHYLIGNDPQQWRTHIRHYAGVRYHQVYPGVDLVCYGSDGRLEYDFVISPGGEPSSIRLAFEGADGLSVDPSGDLVVEISGEQLRHRKPRIYQVAGDRRQPVQGGFVLAGQAEVAFWVGAYDPARTLVIDPVLDYSTYVGGSFGDDNPSLTVDRFGNAFVIAEVFSADFPTTDGVFQPAHQNDSEPEDANDIAIFKLNAIGSALIYSTFLGGSGQELSGCKGAAIAVDGAGNVYVSGRTESADFPTTAGAFDRTLNGAFDTFVAKLDPEARHRSFSRARFLGDGLFGRRDGVGELPDDARRL